MLRPESTVTVIKQRTEGAQPEILLRGLRVLKVTSDNHAMFVCVAVDQKSFGILMNANTSEIELWAD